MAAASVDPPIGFLAKRKTHRLIPAKYAANSVLQPLADDFDQLADVFALDRATNARLIAETSADRSRALELIVPRTAEDRLVNAAFVYGGNNRFSPAGFGAWYAAFARSTAEVEVGFHRTAWYREMSPPPRSDQCEYRNIHAGFMSEFHDLREGEDFAAVLDPNSYFDSQQFAARLREGGSSGILYPSVRHPGGTCLACFRPSRVQNVRLAESLSCNWDGRHVTFSPARLQSGV